MLVAGWDQGIVGMQPGGERLLIVPPEMGYGKKKMTGIPASSTLKFGGCISTAPVVSSEPIMQSANSSRSSEGDFVWTLRISEIIKIPKSITSLSFVYDWAHSSSSPINNRVRLQQFPLTWTSKDQLGEKNVILVTTPERELIFQKCTFVT